MDKIEKHYYLSNTINSNIIQINSNLASLMFRGRLSTLIKSGMTSSACFFGLFKEDPFKKISIKPECFTTLGSKIYPIDAVNVPTEICPKHALMSNGCLCFGYDNKIEIIDKKNNHSSIKVDGNIISMDNLNNVLNVLYKNEKNFYIMKYDLKDGKQTTTVCELGEFFRNFRMHNQNFDHLHLSASNQGTLIANQHLGLIINLDKNINHKIVDGIWKMVSKGHNTFVLTSEGVRDIKRYLVLENTHDSTYTDICMVTESIICARRWSSSSEDSLLEIMDCAFGVIGERIFLPSTSKHIFSDGERIYSISPKCDLK